MVGITMVALFFVFAPVVNPYQFGVDICPRDLIAQPYVSISYFFFRFGGVYFVGLGYHFFVSPFC